MTPTKYQKYVFGLKSGHLKIGANGAGAYTIPRSQGSEKWGILFPIFIYLHTLVDTFNF